MRILMLGLLFGAATMASAQTTVTIDASRDTTLYSENGSVSNGRGEFLFSGRTNQANTAIRRALIGFDDFSAIPPGATITSVELDLTMSRTRAGAVLVTAHSVLDAWGEGASDASGEEGGGGNAQDGDATWTDRVFPGVFWQNQGGDFTPTSVTSEMVMGNGDYRFGSTPEFVSLVVDWINNPEDNHGLLLLADESGPTSAKRFNSRENASGGPQLRITYEGGGSTINPSGLWFTPSLAGDGFNVIYSDGNLLTIFFFGYAASGERLWLLAGPIETVPVIGQALRLDVVEGEGGAGDFNVPTENLFTWGTLDITFTSCTTGTYTLTGTDGSKTNDLTLLARLVGIDCDDGS